MSSRRSMGATFGGAWRARRHTLEVARWGKRLRRERTVPGRFAMGMSLALVSLRYSAGEAARAFNRLGAALSAGRRA